MNASHLAAFIFCAVPGGTVLAQQPACAPADSTAQVGIVVGRVVDGESGVPLGFARLQLQAPGMSQPLETQSDRRGYFAFCTVPAGEVTLWGQVGQFGGLAGPTVLDPGRTLELRLELRGAGRDSGTLAGEVVDAESGRPVEGASLLVYDLGQSSISNELGRFTFPSLPPGLHVMRVNRIGYAEATGEVEVERGRATQTQIRLAVKPVDLAPIVVTAVRRRIEFPGLEDFERRYYSGWGRFVLEEDIQMRSPMKLTDVLTDTGLEITANGGSIIVRRTGCAPMVYIDGVKMTHQPRGGGPPDRQPRNRNRLYAWPDPEESPDQEAAAAVNMIHPSNVAAVEVYKGPAETPGQYIDSNSRCGVILIWTRRGGEVRNR